jgi:hypothetical protein
VLAHVADGEYIGMLETSRKLRLVADSLLGILASEPSHRDQLQGRCTIQLILTRFVNNAHAAVTEFFEQFVVTNAIVQLR